MRAQAAGVDWAMVGAVAQVGLLVVAALSLAVAVPAAVVAWRQVQSQRATAARKATLELISSREIHDPDMDAAKRAFQELKAVADPDALNERLKAEPEKTLRLVKFFNHYELVAAGIRRGIIDEAIYAAWSKTSLVRTWNDAKMLVGWLREQRRLRDADPEKLYAEFQQLAEKWERELIQERNEAAGG